MGRESRDRSFLVLMVGSIVALAVVLSPFLYTFAIAATITVVAWPLYEWLLKRVGGRKRLTALLMTVAVLLLIAIPVAGVIALAVTQTVIAAEMTVVFLASGGLEQRGTSLLEGYERLLRVEALAELLPPPEHLLTTVTMALEQTLLDFTRTVSAGLPSVLGALGRVAVDLTVFCVAVYTCFLRGPAMLDVVRSLSPLRPEYNERLFAVSNQLATNVALGMVATGAAQGVAAGIGFWIGGAPAVVALGVLTAVASLVPVFGSALVFVPVTVGLALGGQVGSAVFVLFWSMGITASVDNVIRPLLLQKQLHISPLLMLIAVLGGLLVMGVQGLVFGPFILVCCTTLYTLYLRDFVVDSANAGAAGSGERDPLG